MRGEFRLCLHFGGFVPFSDVLIGLLFILVSLCSGSVLLGCNMLWVEPTSNTTPRVPLGGGALATSLPGSYDYVDPRPLGGGALPNQRNDSPRRMGWTDPRSGSPSG